MKKKRLISTVLVFTLLCGLVSAFAATVPGSAEDPLISKSYTDTTYPSLVLNSPMELLKNSMTVLDYKLKNMGTSGAKGVYSVTALPGSSISFTTGGSFVLLSGSATLSTGSGTVLDLTSGSELSGGKALSANHRYLAAENTRASAAVSSAAKILIFGDVAVVGGTAPQFTDVTEDKWFYADVCYAVQKGLVEGRSAAIYAPDDNLSIAEAIKLSACMHQLYYTGKVTLKDSPTLWYKSYVDYASQNGIVTKTYKNYDAKISRSEFVSIFHAALPVSEYTEKNTIADNAIPDVKLTDSYAKEIYTFYRAGIVVGKEQGYFVPNSYILRSEVAAILTRMFEKDSRQSIAF